MSPSYSWNLTNSIGNHIVKICSDDALQLETVTTYVKEGLLNEEAVIVFACTSLRKAVIVNLNNLGIDVDYYKSLEKLKFFDADYALTSFYDEGIIDELAFIENIGTPIQYIKSKFGKIRVFSEIVNVLWKKSEHDAAIQLEECWNNLCQTTEFSLLCAYSLESMNSTTFEESIAILYQYHSHLTPVQADVPALENEESILQSFGSAWNRAVERMAANKTISSAF